MNINSDRKGNIYLSKCVSNFCIYFLYVSSKLPQTRIRDFYIRKSYARCNAFDRVNSEYNSYSSYSDSKDVTKDRVLYKREYLDKNIREKYTQT